MLQATSLCHCPTNPGLPISKAALQTYAGLLPQRWQIAEAVDPKEAWRELHKEAALTIH